MERRDPPMQRVALSNFGGQSGPEASVYDAALSLCVFMLRKHGNSLSLSLHFSLSLSLSLWLRSHTKYKAQGICYKPFPYVNRSSLHPFLYQ